MANKLVLIVRNRHSPNCGEPPSIEAGGDLSYVGYFENLYGEQLVYCYDRPSGTGTLRHGDTGWENVHDPKQVTQGGDLLHLLETSPEPGEVSRDKLILSEVEDEWLTLVRSVASGNPVSYYKVPIFRLYGVKIPCTVDPKAAVNMAIALLAQHLGITEVACRRRYLKDGLREGLRQQHMPEIKEM